MKTCIVCNNLLNNKLSKYCSSDCSNYNRNNQSFLKFINGKIDDPKTIKRIYKNLYIENCMICGLNPLWNNKPLSLQLDHIDGNSDNNNPNNLRLLCPNCHSQTDTYSGKNNIVKHTKRNKYLRKFKGYGVRLD